MAALQSPPGRFFEDFRVGDVYRHPYGRTVIEADAVWFALLTGNPHQLHSNFDYSSRVGLDRPLVVSTLTLAIVAGLSVADISLNATANLCWANVRFPAPVFVGDTLYSASEVLAARPSSEPDHGEVTVRTSGENQHGAVVVEFERTILVRIREAAVLGAEE